ncbi:uncharacterized protein MYCGRDRAFT_93990 [Zymoseptoria tritici IPO323]|uniref:Uncharacterized protein n=1 Tax=Zymoseptoria tritici (strain CBS 115943 / IPO323) TaxID=336722 RepID=F9XDP3_ZYMTI|nr:uncharacterized protein MYCGRDRAFT_93990 [Zymoseptoria tritici IPO323]EGP86529.1 hypothetical protein MYCGRDRAFT_93990 [Zymoseptoria tritici IPO323]
MSKKEIDVFDFYTTPHADFRRYRPIRRHAKPYFEPALAHTNRQIQSECRSMFYAENVFLIARFCHNDGRFPGAWAHWTRFLGPDIKHLVNVHLETTTQQSIFRQDGTIRRNYHFWAKIRPEGGVSLKFYTRAADKKLDTGKVFVCLCLLKKKAVSGRWKRERSTGRLLLELVEEVQYECIGKRSFVDCKTCGLECYYTG